MTTTTTETPNRWRGGNCPMHGAYPREGCQDCPPPGHPAHDRERERQEEYAESQRKLAAGICTFCGGTGRVGNAAIWLDPEAAPTALCPRCGGQP